MSNKDKEKQEEQASQAADQQTGEEQEQVAEGAADTSEDNTAEEKADKDSDKGEKKSFFAGLGGKSKTSKLQDELDETLKKNEELKDKYLRLYADFDNYKKRSARERGELTKEAAKDVLLNLLPVLDDFDRAVKQFEEMKDPEAIKEGIQLIQEKLTKNLSAKGLQPMDSMGEPFDTEYHEAITEIPAPTEDMKGKVVDVIEKGYTLNDKIIRYAKVVVGK